MVGPLSDTLYTDWYSASLPYGVTPVQGIQQRLGSNGTVSSTEGVDRIALKDIATGKYLTAPAASTGGPLAATGTSAGDGQALDVFDWGASKLTLRTAANGKYLSYVNSQLVNNAVQPNGWFVQQQLKLDPQPDGSYLLEYAGNETDDSWFGTAKYAVVGADGTLTISASTPAEVATQTGQ